MIIVRKGCVAPSTSQRLLGPNDLTYVGAFRVPSGTFGLDSFDSARAQMTFHQDGSTKTLYIAGLKNAGYNSETPYFAQVSIPTTINDPNSVGLAGLTTASVLQNFADPANGLNPIAPTTSGGFLNLLVYEGNLCGVGARAYDDGSQTTAAFVNSSLTLASPSAAGPYTLDASDPVHGTIPQTVIGGYCSLVPAEWQSALGCKAVCGNNQWSIITYNSAGPALFSFDVDTLITKPATSVHLTATPFAYYWKAGGEYADPESTNSRAGLGRYNSNNPSQTFQGQPIGSFSLTDPMGRTMPSPITPVGPSYTTAMVNERSNTISLLFAEGTRSILFFGGFGLGTNKYGEGVSDPAQDGVANPPDPNPFCYDPDDVGTKGSHVYPYSYFVYAYDVLDYVAVKNGTKNPWEVRPYAGWTMSPYNFDNAVHMSKGLGGAAWDAATRRLYLAAPGGDAPNPLVHVYGVA